MDVESMNGVLVAVLAALMIGGAFSGVMALLLVVTRPYRRGLNRPVIHFGQLLAAGLGVGSVLLVLKTCDGLGLKPHTNQWYAAILAFAIGMVGGEIPTIRAEIRWRKSVGLWQGNRTLGGNKSWISEHPIQYVALAISFAFCAGLGAAALLGSNFLRSFPRSLALYATGSAVLGTILLAYILAKSLRGRSNDKTRLPPSG
jgi:hypothetical protein